MFIPGDEFYFVDASSSGSYSETPIGTFDINRLASGKTDIFYQSSSSVAQKKPKTVILNNWTSVRKNLIDDLLLLGFEVYQIDKDYLVKITNLKQYDRNRQAVLNKKNIANLLSKYNLEHDKVLMLDHSKCNEISSKNDVLYLSEIQKSLLTPDDVELVFKENSCLITDSDSNLFNIDEPKMATGIVTKSHFKFDTEIAFNEKFLQNESFIKQLIFADLSSLEAKCVPSDLLIQLIQRLPKIKELILKDEIFSKLLLSIKDHSGILAELTSLTLSNNSFDLIKMSQTPIIKDFKNISNNKYIIGQNEIWYFNPKQNTLEKLNFSSEKLQKNCLESFDFKPSKSQEALKLITSLTGHSLPVDDHNGLFYDSLSKIPLPNLKKLELKGDVPTKVIGSLLEKGRLTNLSFGNCTTLNFNVLPKINQIKTLKLNGVMLIQDSTSEYSLEHLIELKLIKCEISGKELGKLLKKAPKLKKLDLNRVTITGNLESLLLPELNELFIINSNGSKDSTKNLINANPRLEALEIHNMKIPEKLNPQTNLKFLELGLADGKISTESFSSLLSTTLVSLNITKNMIVPDLNSVELPELKKISVCDGFKLSWNTFIALLKCPNLEFFDISDQLDVVDFKKDELLKIAPQLNLKEFALTPSWVEHLEKDVSIFLNQLPNLQILSDEEGMVQPEILTNIPYSKLKFLEISNENTFNETQLNDFLHCLKNSTCDIKHLTPIQVDKKFQFQYSRDEVGSTLCISDGIDEKFLARCIDVSSSKLELIFSDVQYNPKKITMPKGPSFNKLIIKKGCWLTSENFYTLLDQINYTTFAKDQLLVDKLRITNLSSFDFQCSYKAETITLSGNIDADQLSNLLDKIPYATILNMQSSIFICGNLPKINRSHLKKIALKNVRLSFDTLKTLISSASNACSIDLEGCRILNTNEKIWSSYLKNRPNINAKSIFFGEPEPDNVFLSGGEPNNFPSPSKEGCEELVESKEQDTKSEISEKEGLGGSTFQPPSHLFGTSEKIDANTQNDPDSQFNVTRLFFPVNPQDPIPEINHYRLASYDILKVNSKNCTTNEAFSFLKSDIVLDESIKVAFSDDLLNLGKQLAQTNDGGSYFLGRHKMTLTSKWQALPSFDHNEEITHAQVKPKGGSIQWAYSKQDSLYYIRSTKVTQQEIDLDFLLKLPKKKKESPLIQKEINDLIDFCSSFGGGNLKINEKKSSGDDYLKAMIEQKKGACRHRVVVFKNIMDKKHPNIPVRIITNQCHAYVEVQLDNQWLLCDLGGYDAELNINDSLNPEPDVEKIKKTTLPDEPIKTENINPDLNSKEYKDPAFAPQKEKKKEDNISDHGENLWSQAMLNQRLAAYCQLKKFKDFECFNKIIKQGTCIAISKWYADVVSNKDTKEWANKHQLIRTWNQKNLPDSETERVFNEFLYYVLRYQLNQSSASKSAFEVPVNDLEVFLKQCINKTPLLINNYCHTTAILFKEGTWHFYDPNYIKGIGKTFSENNLSKLAQEIHSQIGYGLTIYSDENQLTCCWSDKQDKINQFIQGGGFYGLVVTKDFEKIKSLDLSRCSLDDLADGFLIVDVDGTPCWAKWIINLHQSGNFLEAQKVLEGLSYCDKKLGDGFQDTLKKQLQLVDIKAMELCLNDVGNKSKTARLILKILSELPKNIQVTPPPKNDFSDWLEKPEIKKPLEPIVKQEKSFKTSKSLLTPEPITISNRFLLNRLLSTKEKPTLPPKTRFKTWEAKKFEHNTSLNAFDFKILQSKGQNILVQMTSDDQVTDYIHHLQGDTLVKQHGLFVINTPADLKCATSWVKIDKNHRGVITKGSVLSEFLQKHKEGRPLIVVNWNNFTAQELVQANTLIDELRKADGVEVPIEAIVLGLQNKESPDAYKNSDFSSRHKETIAFPEWISIPKIIFPKKESSKDTQTKEVVIDFFNESNWQPYLHGKLNIDKNELSFDPSLLIKALEEQKATAMRLILKNAPWHEPEFCFAVNTLISQGYIEHQGQTYQLPKEITIDTSTGYELHELIKGTAFKVGLGFSNTYNYVLNPETIDSFFNNYQSKEGKITTLPGLLECNKGTEKQKTSLTLYLTRELSLSALAKLLSHAKTYDCHVSIHLATGVTLPKEFNSLVTLTQNINVKSPQTNTRLIQSNDLACTERTLIKKTKFDKIINLSELKRCDVFLSVSGFIKEDHIEFHETLSPILKGLIDGENLLLKGRLSTELSDALAPLFIKGEIVLNGQVIKPKGKLVVLTDQSAPVAYMPEIERVNVSFEDKLTALDPKQKKFLLTNYDHKQLIGYSFSYLNTLSKYGKFNHPKDLIAPLRHLPDLPPIESDFDLDKEKSNQFKLERKKLLFDALDKEPIVFLSGKTGVGKSSFIHELKKQVKVHFGSITDWVSASGDGEDKNILFIDEANLQHTDYSMFDGLFSEPRSILYNAVYHLLKPTDYVIFAGNPASYGGRHMPKIFEEHPNVVTFGSMSNAYLYHETLKPILSDIDEQEAQKVATLFLKVFHEVERIDPNAISARELQMMAYKFKVKTIPESALERAKLIAFQMAAHLVKQEHSASFTQWFTKQFGEISAENPKCTTTIGTKKDGFLLTKTHQPLYLNLKDLLDIRSFKEKRKDKSSYGGLSCLIVEGEPGGGKSHLIKQVLLSEDYKELHHKEVTAFDFTMEQEKIKKNGLQKAFYYVPASLSITSKIALYNRAFHEGAILVADELNTSVVLERLSNSLLMGEDLEGRRAIHPGFVLIGTQNPEYMAGRRKAGLAGQRRIQLCQFEEYKPDEMVDVLKYKGCSEEESCNLVYDYINAKKYAEKVNEVPPPSFRDLIRSGNELIKAHETSGSIKAIMKKQASMPYIEVALLECLDINVLEQQKLFEQVKEVGFENLLYENEKGYIDLNVSFLKPGMEKLSNLLENLNQKHLSRENWINDTEPKKVEPKKVEPKKVEPKKEEPKKVEPKKEEPKKVEPKKVEPKKVDPKKVEPKKVEPKKVEPKKVEPKKVEPKKEEPKKEEPKKVEPKKVEPKKVEPKKEEPNKVEPTKVEPTKVEPTQEAHLLKIQFQEALKKLDDKLKQLQELGSKNSRYVSVGKAAKHLSGELKLDYEKLNENIIDLSEYKLRCINSINIAKPEFVKHRGIWMNLDPILRGFIGILAIITVIPALILATTKHGFAGTFFKTFETESAKELSAFEEKLNKKNQIPK